jgi:F-type H+-transporting ATPase subunit c
MNTLKSTGLWALVLVVLLLGATPLLAQETPSTVTFSGTGVGAGLGMALTIIGAGYGLGKIGASALESMARQPEIAGRIQTAMLIIAAMLEGATLASVILCFVLGFTYAKF